MRAAGWLLAFAVLCAGVDGRVPRLPRKSAIVFMADGFQKRVNELAKSLASLDRHFNDQRRYPVIVFVPSVRINETTGLEYGSGSSLIVTEEQQAKLRAATRSPLTFAPVDYDALVDPAILASAPAVWGGPKPRAPTFTIGYRHMCNFFAGPIANHPALAPYRYYWRFDSDSELVEPVGEDPFASMQAHAYRYGHAATDCDWHLATTGLYALARQHFGPELDTKLPKQFRDKSCLRDPQVLSGDPQYTAYNNRIFYNNFELVDLEWMRSPAYQSFYNVTAAAGGIFHTRWGDAPIRTLAALALLPAAAMHDYSAEVSYNHQGYHGPVVKHWTFIGVAVGCLLAAVGAAVACGGLGGLGGGGGSGAASSGGGGACGRAVQSCRLQADRLCCLLRSPAMMRLVALAVAVADVLCGCGLRYKQGVPTYSSTGVSGSGSGATGKPFASGPSAKPASGSGTGSSAGGGGMAAASFGALTQRGGVGGALAGCVGGLRSLACWVTGLRLVCWLLASDVNERYAVANSSGSHGSSGARGGGSATSSSSSGGGGGGGGGGVQLTAYSRPGRRGRGDGGDASGPSIDAGGSDESMVSGGGAGSGVATASGGSAGLVAAIAASVSGGATGAYRAGRLDSVDLEDVIHHDSASGGHGDGASVVASGVVPFPSAGAGGLLRSSSSGGLAAGRGGGGVGGEGERASLLSSSSSSGGGGGSASDGHGAASDGDVSAGGSGSGPVGFSSSKRRGGGGGGGGGGAGGSGQAGGGGTGNWMRINTSGGSGGSSGGGDSAASGLPRPSSPGVLGTPSKHLYHDASTERAALVAVTQLKRLLLAVAVVTITLLAASRDRLNGTIFPPVTYFYGTGGADSVSGGILPPPASQRLANSAATAAAAAAVVAASGHRGAVVSAAPAASAAGHRAEVVTTGSAATTLARTGCYPDDLPCLLAAHADPHRRIVVSTATTGMVDFIRNLLYSLHHLGVRNYLIFALDPAAADFLISRNIPCYWDPAPIASFASGSGGAAASAAGGEEEEEEEEGGDDAGGAAAPAGAPASAGGGGAGGSGGGSLSSGLGTLTEGAGARPDTAFTFGTAAYKAVTMRKNEIMMDVVSAGYNAFFTDADTVWLRNPLNEAQWGPEPPWDNGDDDGGGATAAAAVGAAAGGDNAAAATTGASGGLQRHARYNPYIGHKCTELRLGDTTEGLGAPSHAVLTRGDCPGGGVTGQYTYDVKGMYGDVGGLDTGYWYIRATPRSVAHLRNVVAFQKTPAGLALPSDQETFNEMLKPWLPEHLADPRYAAQAVANGGPGIDSVRGFGPARMRVAFFEPLQAPNGCRLPTSIKQGVPLLLVHANCRTGWWEKVPWMIVNGVWFVRLWSDAQAWAAGGALAAVVLLRFYVQRSLVKGGFAALLSNAEALAQQRR